MADSDRLKGKVLGIVHAALWVAPIANRYTAELLPGRPSSGAAPP